MKKFCITSIFAAVVLLGISCKQTLESLFPGLDVKVPDMQVTIPAIPLVPADEVALGSFTMHFNLDSAIRANTSNLFTINSVSSMQLKEMVASISNGDADNNLSNFESGRILLSSNANTNEAALASFLFPLTETYSYPADTNNSPDILAYYKGTEITYRLFGKLRKPTTKQLNLTVSATIRVR